MGLISPAPRRSDGSARRDFVRPVEQIPNEERSAGIGRSRQSSATARDSGRSDRWRGFRERRSALGAIRAYRAEPGAIEKSRTTDFFNGSADSPRTAAYVIRPPGTMTPAPWVNVLANSQFGTVISERRRVHVERERPEFASLLAQDPVSDMGGEAFYIVTKRPATSGVHALGEALEDAARGAGSM